MQNNDFFPESHPAIFVDRDGTLIEEVNFLSRVDDLRIFDFTFNALKRLKNAGYLILVITNQSGISRGIFTENDMHTIHSAMQDRLNCMIDAFYFCPHLPNSGCRCRKPQTGMIEQAMVDFSIDKSNSWMIGDKAIDVMTGQNAGLNTALVLTGYGSTDIEKLESKPTVTAADFAEAVNRLLGPGAVEF